MNNAQLFETKYKLNSCEKDCEFGNIVNDAFHALPRPDYNNWVDENWDKMSEFEQSVVENIEYGIREGVL